MRARIRGRVAHATARVKKKENESIPRRGGKRDVSSWKERGNAERALREGQNRARALRYGPVTPLAALRSGRPPGGRQVLVGRLRVRPGPARILRRLADGLNNRVPDRAALGEAV